MDAIEPTFRPRYEAISIGNAGPSAQNVFFEGLLLEKGLGVNEPWYGDSSWGHEGFNRKSVSWFLFPVVKSKKRLFFFSMFVEMYIWLMSDGN